MLHLRNHNPLAGSGRRVLVLAVAAGVLLLASPAAMAITVDEVITLTKLGIAPDEIVKAIEKDRTVFNLSVTDILGLKKAAVDDKVIKFMLGTPQKYGAAGAPGTQPGTTGPGTTTTPPPGDVEPRVETEEERKIREEKLRQDSIKLLEERKRAEEAQRAAYAKGVLARGRSLGDAGKFVEAIQAFQAFMEQGGYPPDSEEAYFAKFGIANALVRAGLHQAAARQLVEVLLAGPDKPFFQTAFEQLRELRSKVNYAPPDLEQLTRYFVGNYSQAFQAEFNYVLGEFYYDYNNWSQALKYLEQVSPDSPDYAKAQYLKGLVEVRNQLFKSAVGSFQRAIVATEENGSEPAILDLGYLALARIAYQNNNPDAAIYYYRKIPKASIKSAQAFYESGWVYFVKGDASRALGTFHTLHSPFFQHQFYPELWILEATMYMNLCRFDDAEEALAQFTKKVSPIAVPLKEFLLKTVRPEDYYKALVETVAGKKLYALPKRVIPAVLSDVEFYNLYRTIKQIEREIDIFSPNVNLLGPFGQDVVGKLQALHRDRVREVGIKIQRVLKEVETSLADYELKVKEIEVDVQDEMLKEEERKLRALEDGEQEKRIRRAAQGGTTAIVGSTQWQWPYEGEYWRDEIGTYRAFVADKCAREASGQ